MYNNIANFHKGRTLISYKNFIFIIIFIPFSIYASPRDESNTLFPLLVVLDEKLRTEKANPIILTERLTSKIKEYSNNKITFSELKKEMRIDKFDLHSTESNLYKSYIYWQQELYQLTLLFNPNYKCQGNNQEIKKCYLARRKFPLILTRFPHLDFALNTSTPLFLWKNKSNSVIYQQVIVEYLPDPKIDWHAKLFYLNQYFKHRKREGVIKLFHYFIQRGDAICVMLVNIVYIKFFTLLAGNKPQDITPFHPVEWKDCTQTEATCMKLFFSGFDANKRYILHIENHETQSGKTIFSTSHQHDDL